MHGCMTLGSSFLLLDLADALAPAMAFAVVALYHNMCTALQLVPDALRCVGAPPCSGIITGFDLSSPVTARNFS